MLCPRGMPFPSPIYTMPSITSAALSTSRPLICSMATANSAWPNNRSAFCTRRRLFQFTPCRSVLPGLQRHFADSRASFSRTTSDNWSVIPGRHHCLSQNPRGTFGPLAHSFESTSWSGFKGKSIKNAHFSSGTLSSLATWCLPMVSTQSQTSFRHSEIVQPTLSALRSLALRVTTAGSFVTSHRLPNR